MIPRKPNLLELLDNSRSFFLFGPRGTGKSSLLAAAVRGKKNVLKIDLLDADDFRRYLTSPTQLSREVESMLKDNSQVIVILDEIQKLPELLDEVHRLIEKFKKKVVFALSGSSARKLKRSGANLLAGRAWMRSLFPLSSLEVEIDLENAMKFGTLPKIFTKEDIPREFFKAYVDTYLREEILQEALVRKVDSFSLFLDLAAQLNSEQINFTKLGKQIHVDVKTVQEYFQILEDTLIAKRVAGWGHSVKRQLVQAPKFYFFDCGLLNSMRGEIQSELKTESYRYGKLFETFIVNELIHYNEYLQLDYKMFYWRTQQGKEVDVILAPNLVKPEWAIEIKSKVQPNEEDIEALSLFLEDYPKAKTLVICRTPRAYEIKGIPVLPWLDGVKFITKR